jgi:hypothetical protein
MDAATVPIRHNIRGLLLLLLLLLLLRQQQLLTINVTTMAATAPHESPPTRSTSKYTPKP